MSLFAQYVNELTNSHVLEWSQGFIWYEINGDECYAREVFVEPVARRTGLVRDMEAELIRIAKEAGCKRLSGSVIPTNNGSTDSLRFMLAMGYSLRSSSVNFISFVKEL
jgi:GNAT superfamily N-acetyltransferase